MGPTLARLARRACAKAGVKKRILGAARFSGPASRQSLETMGIETISCDLLDRDDIAKLPDCANVMYMVGQKFGTRGNQSLTWATNSYVPGVVAGRYPTSRIVAFSTGNVYPLTPLAGGGPKETDPTGPIGEYAQSALGRERIFEFFSRRDGIRTAILRLNYAIDLRYGVLSDLAQKIAGRTPVNVEMGYVNIIWQRDANSIALRSLAHCAAPPFVLNVTGPEAVSVRELAQKLGQRLAVEPVFEGCEAETALLNNATKCWEMFGPPTVTIDEMVAMVADWVKGGGRSLGKPTHFEERTGVF
jgi:nucleoside-diphosphate-sugar epimerase